jgi:hypothetical protein
MDWVYRGLYLIGDKTTGRITNVQVGDNVGRKHSLPLAIYLARGIEPDHRTLPWQEDIYKTPARPEKEKDQSEPYKGFQIRAYQDWQGQWSAEARRPTTGIDTDWIATPSGHPTPKAAIAFIKQMIDSPSTTITGPKTIQ